MIHLGRWNDRNEDSTRLDSIRFDSIRVALSRRALAFRARGIFAILRDSAPRTSRFPLCELYL